MASAINWRTRPEATPRPPEDVSIAPTIHLLGIFGFSLPYLILGWLMEGSFFLGNTRARLLGKVLVAIGDGRLEHIVLGYPLIPSLLASVRPMPSTLMLASALTAGATLWLLWRTLATAPLSLVARLVVLFTFAAAPTTMFLATQSFGEMLALLLILVAWNNFVAFARNNTTWNGFLAGLVIGLAFFVSLYALVYALVFVLSAPFYLYEHSGTSWREQRPRVLTGTSVIAFPVVIAFLAWSFLSWIFYGDPFSYMREIISPLSAFVDSPAAPVLGLRAVLDASLYDVLRLPLYVMVGVLTAIYARHRLVTFFVPILMIILTRLTGWTYGEPFALATLMMVALAGIPMRRHLAWLLIPMALLQIGFGYALPLRSDEQRVWRSLLLSNSASVEDKTENEVARRLADLAPDSVLIDGAASYRIIARMGTASPLLDSDDPAYQLAVSAPSSYVEYVLITAGDDLAARFADAPPEFVIEASWATGTLYRRVNSGD